jgi:hypothetical protein
MKENTKRRKYLTSFCTYSILLAAVIGCSQVESEFDRKRSPHGEADLIVTVAESALPHGKFKIFVYIAINGGVPEQIAATTMENDGVPFTKKNIGLRWTSAKQALVCLRPTDLADRGVFVTLGDKPSAEIRTGC